MQAVEAAEYGESDVLRVVEMDAPKPGPGEVAIDVEAVGVNFADIKRRRGTSPSAPTPPFVPGIEAAGTVRAVGDGVDAEPGERVAAYLAAGHGAYAEVVVADASGVIPIPAEMSAAEAAGLPIQYLTAHNSLHAWAGVEPGERVLVHAAAGGVGTAAVQLASAAGAEVFATASTAEKLALASRLGADHGINYTEEDVAAAVADRTDGAGVDVVLDGVGGDVFDASLDAVADGGRIVTIGAASGRNGRPDTGLLRQRNVAVLGYHLGGALAYDPDRVRAAIPHLLGLYERGAFEVVVGARFDLAAAGDAHDLIERRESTGKVVLEP